MARLTQSGCICRGRLPSQPQRHELMHLVEPLLGKLLFGKPLGRDTGALADLDGVRQGESPFVGGGKVVGGRGVVA